MGTTSIIRKVKVRSINIYTIVFSVLFSIGLLGGSSLGGLINSPGIQGNQMITKKSSIPENGPMNLLLIAVQDLTSPEPVLESVWLLISSPRTGILTLLPILPDHNGVISSAQFGLKNTLSLTTQNSPHSTFFEQLHKNFWWDNYILVDRVGISKIMDNIHPFSVLDSEDILESIPSVWENPTEALFSQTELFRKFCEQFKSVPYSDKKNILINKMGDYIQTDMDWSEFIGGWSTDLTKGHHFECEFPTLTLEKK